MEHVETDEGDHAGGAHRSRWPTLAAAGAGALYAGAGVLFVGASLVPPVLGWALVVVGVAGTVVGLAGWLREAFLVRSLDGGSRPHQRLTLRAATVAFLLTDVATFAALFAYYLFVRVGAWPPTEVPPLLGSLVLFNTVALLASSVTLHFAHEALGAGDRTRFRRLLGVTVALGVAFVLGQVAEYAELLTADGFSLTSGAFGSAFYGLTGLHGFHVALGVVMLGVVFGRALAGHYDADRDTSVTTVSLYWHFVDAVWILLVAVLYVGATV